MLEPATLVLFVSNLVQRIRHVAQNRNLKRRSEFFGHQTRLADLAVYRMARHVGLLNFIATAANSSLSSYFGSATIFPSGAIELDLENSGNPLAAQFGPLMRLATRLRQRAAAWTAKMMEAAKGG